MRIPTGDDKRVYRQIDVGIRSPVTRLWWHVKWGDFVGHGATKYAARRDLEYGVERYLEEHPKLRAKVTS